MLKPPLKNIGARLIYKGPGFRLILILLCLLPGLMACQGSPGSPRPRRSPGPPWTMASGW